MIYTRQLIHRLTQPKSLFNYVSKKHYTWSSITYFKCSNLHKTLKCPIDIVDKIIVTRMNGVNLLEFIVNDECIHVKDLDRKIPLIEQVTRTLFL
jgi:hypothetical protein